MTRRGCRLSVLPYLAACIAVVVLLAGVDAAPGMIADSGSAGPRSDRTPVRSPVALAAEAGTNPKAPGLRSRPSGTSSLPPSAVILAQATWCKPTPTQCQNWGGDAKVAGVHSFTFGDVPYWVRVTRGSKHVDVLVVSHCACQDRSDRIDLSASAFLELAPLSRGRIDVEVMDIPEGPDDAAMRAEVRGDELYQLPQTDSEEPSRE